MRLAGVPRCAQAVHVHISPAARGQLLKASGRLRWCATRPTMHSSFVAVHNADASTEPGGYEEPRRHPMKKMSVHNFSSDLMFPRIERAVAEQLAKGNVVAPVGVLIGMGLLRPEHLADWRRGRVAYLEHVINCNLSRLSRLLRILRFHAHDLNLKPSLTVYKRHGKGPKQQLRF